MSLGLGCLAGIMGGRLGWFGTWDWDGFMDITLTGLIRSHLAVS